MALSKEMTQEIIAEYATKPKDTGSAEVQIALLTKRIEALVEHLKQHKQDHHSKKGLLDLISQRKKLSKFLKAKDFNRYKELIGRLGLRK